MNNDGIKRNNDGFKDLKTVINSHRIPRTLRNKRMNTLNNILFNGVYGHILLKVAFKAASGGQKVK